MVSYSGNRSFVVNVDACAWNVFISCTFTLHDEASKSISVYYSYCLHAVAACVIGY